jgi:hypothetical protein
LALFTRKQNSDNPGAEKDSAERSGKQESVRGMAGYRDLSDVKNSAPDSTAGFSVDPDTPRRRTRATNAAATEQQKEAAAAAEAERLRLRALETAGKHILGKLASVPYDAWAMMAADEYYHLKPEEVKELADSYYIIAQGMKIDFSKPIWMMVGVLSLHSVLIADRLKHMAEEKRKDEEKKLMEQVIN